MNSLPQTTSTVNVAINTKSYAYTLGAEAGKANESCVPEMIYVRRQDQINFAAGFESVSGPTFATVQFTGSSLPEPSPVAKSHNWGDFNADRAIARIEAHQRKVARAYEMSCAFLGADCGDIIFMAA